jgi:D-alanine-D-alanine ligase
MAGSDVEVPVITIHGEPVVMPPMLFKQADPTHLRTHAEKRDLVEREHKYTLVPFEADAAWERIREMTLTLAEIFRPFDFGRFEFRFNEATGEVNLLEVYGRSAVLMGWSQEDLIETIVAESLRRHGLMPL